MKQEEDLHGNSEEYRMTRAQGPNRSFLTVQFYDDNDKYDKTDLYRTKEYKLRFSVGQIELHAAMNGW